LEENLSTSIPVGITNNLEVFNFIFSFKKWATAGETAIIPSVKLIVRRFARSLSTPSISIVLSDEITIATFIKSLPTSLANKLA
jgi:hypothetical protein